MKIFFLLMLVLLVGKSFAQQEDSFYSSKDSLQSITIQAFKSNKNWLDIPVAVSVITQKDLQKISNTSLLPAINSVPGIRMEERSPESYRLSIRGSTLRSPFGVRNVKIYWNDIPLTDGGGNTYLNLIDINQLNGVEVIKGPSASMYGAGTGGVLLLTAAQPFLNDPKNSVHASISGGSFNLLNEQTIYAHQSNRFNTGFQQSHIEEQGYRAQSALGKDLLKWDASFKLKHQEISFLLLYSDLFYQTPGGLTKAQMLQDPHLARPASGIIPGAIQQQAAVYNKTIFTGFNHHFQLNKSWSTETSFVLSHTAFTNPAIAVYENRDETNAGIRTKIIYGKKIKTIEFKWITGGELLYNHSRIDDYANKNGNPDTLQLKDDLYASQWFTFSQIQLNYKSWCFNTGISVNNEFTNYKRLTDVNTNYVTASNKNISTPRISLLYKLGQHVSIYSLAAKGFSPPSLAELHPQDRIFHSELQPEYGWNFETGIKADILDHRVQFDLAIYDFELQNAIVIRNNLQGAQYFVNAGTVSEKGVEISLKYHLLPLPSHSLKELSIWGSDTYQPFYFSSYIQGSSNYAGNAVTGVPKNNIVIGLTVATNKNYYLNIQYIQTSSLPLDDANDEFTNPSHLLQLNAGNRFRLFKTSMNLFFAADNILNEVYSLGNDINAAAKRFYNPAPSRNFYLGMKVAF